MRRTGERLAMTVSDDGVGFPDTVDFGKTQTLGLQLVNILAHQLEGSVGLEETRIGTRVHVDFVELDYAERI
jgi:two-component sensor histidine kinase